MFYGIVIDVVIMSISSEILKINESFSHLIDLHKVLQPVRSIPLRSCALLAMLFKNIHVPLSSLENILSPYFMISC